MHKVIVYGLGKDYKEQSFILEREFEIIAVSDKNTELCKVYDNYVKPAQIPELEYEYVYISSSKYYEKIKKELQNQYMISSNRILGIRDMWWNVNNANNRREWVIDQLTSIPAGMRILDAGAGNQQYRKYCDHLEYVSQDFGQYDNNHINKGILESEDWKSMECDIVSDIIDIPVDNHSFDAVLCSEVIEHLRNPVLAINEFSRILKKGGILLLTAPFCSLTHMAPFYYSNGFSLYWYKDILYDAGFEIIEIQTNGNFFSYLSQELIRTGYMVNRYNGEQLTDSDYDVLFDLIKMMMRQSIESRGSEECLCLGYFVKARKK